MPAEWNGYMTEEEFDRIYGETTWGVESDDARKALAECRLWTHIEGEDNRDLLSPGWHLVNAIQLVVSERPWPNCDIQDVLLDGVDHDEVTAPCPEPPTEEA